VFAKPDAVMEERLEGWVYLVEFKSRLLPYAPHDFIEKIRAKEMLQCLISAHVYREASQQSQPVVPVLRYSNAVITFENWEKVTAKLDFYRKLYFTVEKQESVSATALATFIGLVDVDWMVEPLDEAEAILRGKAMERMVLHGGFPEEEEEIVIGDGESIPINPATGLPMLYGMDGFDVAGSPYGMDWRQRKV
jgi:hypothetical protein